MAAPLSRPTAVRGPALSFTGDPFRDGLDATMVHEPDAVVVMTEGRITHFGPASRIAPLLPAGTEVRDYGRDALISAGFVDTPVHYPQTPMIASHGGQLLEWLNRYTFPTELKFADKEFARRVAKLFLQENLRNGITTSCVYCTVHPHSVDALFEEAEAIGLRLAAGKAVMDRSAPEAVRDTAQSGYDESPALIAKWHGRGRLLYAITPRYAGTSTSEQLPRPGHSGRNIAIAFEPTSRSRDEVAWMKGFPDRRNYRHLRSSRPVRRARDLRAWRLVGRGRDAAPAAWARSPIARSNFFSAVAPSISRAPKRARSGRPGNRHRRGHLVLDPGDARRRLQSQPAQPRVLSVGHAYYLATRSSARAMYLDTGIGSLAADMESRSRGARVRSTPLIVFE